MSVGNSGYESTTTINAVDPEAARKLATLSEEQLALYKEHFLPYERELANANLAVLPERQGLTTEELATQRELLPLRRRVAQAGLEETLFDLELGRPVKEALVSEQLAEMERARPVADAFYAQAAKGSDTLGAMGRASADVAAAYKGAEGAARRAAGRSGASSGSMLSTIARDRARTTAGARTAARVGEDDKAWAKLATAMSMRGRASGLPGVASTSTGAGGAMPYQTGGLPGLPVGNPADRALAALNAGTRTQSQSSSQSGGAGIGGFLGNVGGQAAGIGLMSLLL